MPARREGIDDVAFVEAVVDAVGAARGTDPNRVYAVGFSNGGQMVIRLLHQVPQRLAGAALIAAAQPVRANFLFADATAVPRPVLLIHGTKDPVSPYEGGMTSLSSVSAPAAWGCRRSGRRATTPSAMASTPRRPPAACRTVPDRDGPRSPAPTTAAPEGSRSPCSP